jgi:hypothetical protein
VLIKELVHESKNIIICDLASEMGISFGSCQNGFPHNACLVSRLTSKSIITSIHSGKTPQAHNSFLKVITDDVTWIYIMTLNETTVFSMEELIIAMPEEGQTSWFQYYEQADGVF